MSSSQLLVGPQLNPDFSTTPTTARCGRGGEMLTSGLHGTHYEQTSRFNRYVGITAAAGVALTDPNNVGNPRNNQPTLWNPAGSGVNLSISSLELMYVAGTCSPGAVEWCYIVNTGSQASTGTGSPILTATRAAPISGCVSQFFNSKAYWVPAAITYTAVPVFYRSTGISLMAGAAATAIAPYRMRVDYDGDLVLSPGNALVLAFQTTTTTATFQISIAWEEVPI